MTTAVILSRDRKAKDLPRLEANIQVGSKRTAYLDLEHWVMRYATRDREYAIWVTPGDWQYWLYRPTDSVEWDQENPI